MKSVFELLALCSCGLFAGAALYVSLVEHPARMSSFTSGTAAWLARGGVNCLIGALLVGSVIPFTLIFILSTNRRLLDTALDPSSDCALRLLRQWGRLHAVRTVLSLAAFGLFASAMILGW
jgi:uncharacterized membrane protein